MKPILGHEIGQALCDALGLPKRTVAFTLRCRAMEAVRVKCEYYPEDAGAIRSALMEYELVPHRAAWGEPPTESSPGGLAPCVETMGYDAWLKARTDAAHAEYMRRTSVPPSCDWRTFPPEEISRYFGIPLEELA
ncbi:hypothetical protein [Massilia haematophila]|uniref:Uncharacterized protein n=1 Tax=Massilia haematophila TaxID=457923 RepID=A0ABV7PDK2_9BURK